MENFLLNGESLITQSPNNVVMLTSHRIRYNAASSSYAHLVSMMLEKVSSCEVRYQSHPGLLILGLLVAGLGSLGFAGNGDTQAMAMAAIVIGLVLVLVYFSTRKHIVSIASDGGSRIGFETKGMKREAIVAFVNAIEKAKVKRVEQLQQLASPILV
ncbi:hypothetical protein D0N36_03370 [Hymenobacter lapidiphilus]|uniref:hypothetical protein n=1 Tax=Hymenobacter sp. CCM 8763 TaxID=2303334 RepID=UPI000E3451EB|nr:hypothetical protein [Hymenobacter sp. CCM 8763]RFP66401.1 hypothetical protein D0N36_03370 [Hymenobacter sp. CCM 8763]